MKIFWHIGEIIGDRDQRQYEIKANLFQAYEVSPVDQPEISYRLRAIDYPGQQWTKSQKEDIHQKLMHESQRWKNISLAIPTIIDLFWYADQLCWVENKIEGSPLSAIDQPLSIYEGYILLIELLKILGQFHQNRELIGNTPLLHLNLTPDRIFRAEDGSLYCFDPMLPSLIELNYKSQRQRVGETDIGFAPELSRGRFYPNTDIFAVGMTVLSAMSGLSIQKVDERIQAGAFFEHDLKLSLPLQRVFEALVNFKASERIESTELAIIQLEALPPHAIPPPPINAPYISPRLENHRKHKKNQDELTHALVLSNGESSNSINHVSSDGQIPKEIHADLIDQQEKIDSLLLSIRYQYQKHKKILLLFFLLTLLLMTMLIVHKYNTPSNIPSNAPINHEGNHLHIHIHTTQSSKHPSINQQALEPLPTSHDPLIKVNQFTPKSSLTLENETEIELNQKATALEQSYQKSSSIQWIKIKGGQFTMGAKEDFAYDNEKPTHIVDVKDFEISQSEVTVAQYAKCVEEKACDTDGLDEPSFGDIQLCNWNHQGDRKNMPMNCISWFQAKKFAKWLNGDLPSEAEWEYAAKNQGEDILYPWGNENKGCKYAVLADAQAMICGYQQPMPICSLPIGNTKQNLCDMVGNVLEWTADEWHDSYVNAPHDALPWNTHDAYQWDLVKRSVRGGGAFDDKDFPRITRRTGHIPDYRSIHLGLRVVKRNDSF